MDEKDLTTINDILTLLSDLLSRLDPIDKATARKESARAFINDAIFNLKNTAEILNTSVTRDVIIKEKLLEATPIDVTPIDVTPIDVVKG